MAHLPPAACRCRERGITHAVPPTHQRVPRHVGIIPDGNRRWADARRLARGDGYAAGIAPGIARGPESLDIPRIDLVVRWGARHRLSGFLPLQSAYADPYVIETLWPDMRLAEFDDALAWYAMQDVTLGG